MNAHVINSHDPSDYAPLSYGAGLAVGLMLILGLPAEKNAAAHGQADATRLAGHTDDPAATLAARPAAVMCLR